MTLLFGGNRQPIKDGKEDRDQHAELRDVAAQDAVKDDPGRRGKAV